MSLARFFSMAEELGDAAIPAQWVVARLGLSLVGELLAAKLLVDAGIPLLYPCGGGAGRRCARQIVTNHEWGALPVLATCGRSPAACPPLRLSEQDARVLRIDRGRVEAALTSLLRLSGERADLGLGVSKLGEQPRRGNVRDVLLAWTPGEPSFELFVAARERRRQRALLLVPTLTEVPSNMLVAYARSRRLELGVIAEMVTLQTGELALRERPLAPRLPRKARLTLRDKLAAGKLELPCVERWEEVGFHRPNDDDLILIVGGREMRVTHVDLGMVRANGTPSLAYTLLLAVCDRHGWFPGRLEWRADNVRVTRLRDALRAAFGLSEDPFYDWRRKVGWRARFRASTNLGKASVVSVE